MYGVWSRLEGFWCSGLGSGVSGTRPGLRVQDTWSRIQNSEFRMEGFVGEDRLLLLHDGGFELVIGSGF